MIHKKFPVPTSYRLMQCGGIHLTRVADELGAFSALAKYSLGISSMCVLYPTISMYTLI